MPCLLTLCLAMNLLNGVMADGAALSLKHVAALPRQSDAGKQQNTPLALSAAQRLAMQSIRVRSEQVGKPVALHMARLTRQIYANMLAAKPDEKLRRRLSKQLNGVVLQLLKIKGESIRDTVNILTPEQKQRVKQEMLKPEAPADLTEIIAKALS